MTIASVTMARPGTPPPRSARSDIDRTYRNDLGVARVKGGSRTTWGLSRCRARHSWAIRGCLAMATSVALTACGGSDPASSSAALVGPAFAARALSVCSSAQKSKQAWTKLPVSNFNPKTPDVRQLPHVAAWLDGQVAPTFDAWLRDLTSLGQPPSGGAAWTEVLALVGRIDSLNNDQIHAARAGDAHAFADATDGLERLQPQLVQATRTAGVGKCADVHGR